MSDEELIQRLGSQHTAAIARLNASNVIDDLKPCPSCREPLDHPSGDGCANMTAHKERAMTDEELIARLREGATWDDDVAAADRIEALTKERDEAVEALEQIARPKVGPDFDWTEDETNKWRAVWYRKYQDIARAALAEIKGESHD